MMRIRLNNRVVVPQGLNASIRLTGEHINTEPYIEQNPGYKTVCSGTLSGENNRDLTYQIDWDRSKADSEPHWNFRIAERVRIPGRHMKFKELTNRLPREMSHVSEPELIFSIESDSSEVIISRNFKGTL